MHTSYALYCLSCMKSAMGHATYTQVMSNINETRHTSINHITHGWVMYHIQKHTSFERYFLRCINGTICATWSSGIFSNMRVLFKNLLLNHTISELYHLIWLFHYFTYFCVRGTSFETHFTSHLTLQNMLFLITLTLPCTLFGLLLTLTLVYTLIYYRTFYITHYFTAQSNCTWWDMCVHILHRCMQESHHTHEWGMPHVWIPA